MKTWNIVALLLFFVLNANVSAQHQELRMEAEPDRLSYCDIDRDLFATLVTFRLSLTNTSHSSLIASSQLYPTVVGAGTIEHLRKGNYNFQRDPPDLFIRQNPDESRENTKPMERVEIRPGQGFESTTMAITLQTAKPGYTGADGIQPGTYYIQVILRLREITSANKLVVVRSQPVKIILSSKGQLPACK